MKRYLEAQNAIKVLKHSDGSSSIELRVGKLLLDRILLELYLLQQNLATTLTLGNGDRKLRLTIDGALEFSRISACDEKKISISLDGMHAGYMASFLLKYYRDGRAEVDHIDIELESEAGKMVYFIVSAEDTKQPMSGEEMTRLLLSRR